MYLPGVPGQHGSAEGQEGFCMRPGPGRELKSRRRADRQAAGTPLWTGWGANRRARRKGGIRGHCCFLDGKGEKGIFPRQTMLRLLSGSGREGSSGAYAVRWNCTGSIPIRLACRKSVEGNIYGACADGKFAVEDVGTTWEVSPRSVLPFHAIAVRCLFTIRMGLGTADLWIVLLGGMGWALLPELLCCPLLCGLCSYNETTARQMRGGGDVMRPKGGSYFLSAA